MGTKQGDSLQAEVSVVFRCLLAMSEVEAGLGGGRSQTESALAPSEGLLTSGLTSPGQSSAPGGLNWTFLGGPQVLCRVLFPGTPRLLGGGVPRCNEAHEHRRLCWGGRRTLPKWLLVMVFDRSYDTIHLSPNHMPSPFSSITHVFYSFIPLPFHLSSLQCAQRRWKSGRPGPCTN